MEKINQFALYEIGQTFQKLRKADTSNVDAFDAFWDLSLAQAQIDKMLSGTPFALGVSAGKASEVRQAIQNTINRNFYAKNPDGTFALDEEGKCKWDFPARGTKKIESWELSMVTNALDKFETVFAEEMREGTSYHIPQRGITSVVALVEHGEKAFPEELGHIIGIKAMADFKAACRCFAFDLYTASGYHSARAVEAVLETYYQTFANKPGETLRGWNDYVEALKKVKDKKPKQKYLPDGRTLLSVDEIRFHHRNPLMHPRVTLTETDADMLLSIAKVAMLAMSQEIKCVWSERKAIAAKIKAKQKG